MRLWRAALLARCPACGQGRVFAGFFRIAESCGHCGLSLAAHEKGDGPAFFVIVVVGFFVTFLAAWVELAYQPPYWLHLALWAPLTLALSLVLLRFFKALMIALQWRHTGL